MAVKFVCTDKGQHDRIWLRGGLGRRNSVDPFRGRVGRKRDHGAAVLQLQVKIRGERTPGGWLDPDKPGGVELLCPTCGRNPQISQQKLELLERAALTEVDISRLPF